MLDEQIDNCFNSIFDKIQKEIEYEKQWNDKINDDYKLAEQYRDIYIDRQTQFNNFIDKMDLLFERYVELIQQYSSAKIENYLEVDSIPLPKNVCKEVEEEQNNEVEEDN